MDHWQLAYLGMRQIPRELSEFELSTFFIFSAKERAAPCLQKTAHAAVKFIDVFG